MPENSTMLDFDRIRSILPQCYPCLMIDRARVFKEEKRAVGIKNVSMNEPFFQGHFPGSPVLPGVLILEAMVQTGGMIVRELAGPETDFAFIMSISKVKFRKPVLPGDRLIIDAELLRLSGGIARIRATARVRDRQSCQAEFTLGIPENISETLRPAEFAPELMLNGKPMEMEPMTDINGVVNTIPHRYPFILVDSILMLKEPLMFGLKNVTGNDPFLQGHFPKHAVMPGTLLIEAMAQVGAVYILNMPQNKNKLGYLMAIDRARFRRPVTPGDQLVIAVETLGTRLRVGKARGRIHVGNETVAEAMITFVIVDRADAGRSG